MKDIFKGFSTQYPRSTFMMTFYFCQVDSLRRHTSLFDSKLGQFIASGGSACTGFLLIWPLEVLKNLTQAETKGIGNTNLEKARYIIRTQGVAGFYRGFIPGGQSVFLRNGAAMIVMQKA